MIYSAVIMDFKMAGRQNTENDICTAHVYTLSCNTDQFSSHSLNKRYVTYYTLATGISAIWIISGFQIQNGSKVMT